MLAAAPFWPVGVAARRELGQDLVWLALQAPTELAIQHRLPGQYLQVRCGPGEAPAYMALANAPGEPWALLVKAQGGGARIAEAQEGQELELGAPMGPGYPLEAVPPGGDLLLVGVGTGLAPLRSALHEALTQRSRFGRLVWVAGAKDPASMPFLEEWARWRSEGVEVLPCYSQASVPQAQRGHVQDHLSGALGGHAGSFTALMCGMPAMEAGVREALVALGLPPGALHRNH